MGLEGNGKFPEARGGANPRSTDDGTGHDVFLFGEKFASEERTTCIRRSAPPTDTTRPSNRRQTDGQRPACQLSRYFGLKLRFPFDKNKIPADGIYTLF